MVSRFVRKVRTASGAVAVQIVNQNGRTTSSIEHIGSAHNDAELGLLLETAQRQLHPGQQAFDFDGLEQEPVPMAAIADWTGSKSGTLPGTSVPPNPVAGPVAAGAKVISSPAAHLWQVLTGAYARLGFDVLEDEGFRAMVLARLVEPASKADTICQVPGFVDTKRPIKFLRC